MSDRTVLQDVQEAVNACNTAIAYVQAVKEHLTITMRELDSILMELSLTKDHITSSATTLGFTRTDNREPLPHREPQASLTGPQAIIP